MMTIRVETCMLWYEICMQPICASDDLNKHTLIAEHTQSFIFSAASAHEAIPVKKLKATEEDNVVFTSTVFVTSRSFIQQEVFSEAFTVKLPPNRQEVTTSATIILPPTLIPRPHTRKRVWKI